MHLLAQSTFECRNTEYGNPLRTPSFTNGVTTYKMLVGTPATKTSVTLTKNIPTKKKHHTWLENYQPCVQNTFYAK